MDFFSPRIRATNVFIWLISRFYKIKYKVEQKDIQSEPMRNSPVNEKLAKYQSIYDLVTQNMYVSLKE